MRMLGNTPERRTGLIQSGTVRVTRVSWVDRIIWMRVTRVKVRDRVSVSVIM